MSDDLRDRIKGIIDVHDEKFFDGDYPTTLAQAIIDDLGLTTRGTCGYVEIYGHYDTKFEENDQ